MKKIFSLLIAIVLFQCISAQQIRIISAYDNQSSYTSGLYALQDTAIYRYSWYYQEWFSLNNKGLTRINDTIRISSLAVYNNKTSNSSGIFVFSDTAVFNYNWITATWYPLSNDGLPRILNKPDVRMLTVYGDSGSSSNSTIFALTDTAVYRYSWYYQEWYSLSNSGLSFSVKEVNNINEFQASAFPNPSDHNLTINLTLPESINDKIKIAFFDEKGIMLKYLEQSANGEKEILIEPDLSSFPSGIYFCEIKAGKKFKTIRVIRK
jgi:hypothetical protein